MSVASTVLSLLVGVPAAYALSRWTRRGGGAITLWILASRMAPPIAFTIPYFLVYRHLELLDTLTGLAIIYLTTNLSLVIWMMRPFYDQLPRSLEEAAWIDGATMWQGFTRDHPAALGAGPRGDRDPLLPVRLERLLLRPDPDPHRGDDRAGRRGQLHELRRLGVGPHRCRRHMIMLPVLVFSFIVRRYLVSGLTGGAIKG